MTYLLWIQITQCDSHSRYHELFVIQFVLFQTPELWCMKTSEGLAERPFLVFRSSRLNLFCAESLEIGQLRWHPWFSCIFAIEDWIHCFLGDFKNWRLALSICINLSIMAATAAAQQVKSINIQTYKNFNIQTYEN